jgi:hypothetical protein
MIVSINQPAYLPWLGFFHRIAISDVHIVLDHVQFEKNSYTNRNKVRTKDGWCWLTVPLQTKGKFGSLYINQIEIADRKNWARKHWLTIQSNYKKTPYVEEHATFFEKLYSQQWESLSALLGKTTSCLLNSLGIKTPIIYSSEMNVKGEKDNLILNLCKSVGAKTYISGPFGRDYLRKNLFLESGINIIYHDYIHPVYAQAYPGFEPYMSIIDLLFNHGPKSLEILSQNQKKIQLSFN